MIPMFVILITTLPLMISFKVGVGEGGGGYLNSIYMMPLTLSHGITKRLKEALSLGYHQV